MKIGTLFVNFFASIFTLCRQFDLLFHENILKYLSVFLKKGGREMFSNKHPGTPGF